MTVRELIEALQLCNPGAEVRCGGTFEDLSTFTRVERVLEAQNRFGQEDDVAVTSAVYLMYKN
ncbi:MAG: hypothetical protein PHT30_04460 [Bacilli bacterium]|nr:hypothetical protein [Bacilli bacterium]